jgi:hypothetical protein
MPPVLVLSYLGYTLTIQRLRSSSALALKIKNGRGKTKAKEKIGANKTLY